MSLNGIDDRADSVSDTAVTNSAGAYGFTRLRPGTYTITHTQPAGYLPGKVVAAGESNVSVTQPTLQGGLGQIALSVDPGESAASNNFAELQTASFSGYVWDDLNNDGVMETGEAGIAGATVTLTGTSDLGAVGPISVLSSASRRYSFANLRPGVYTLAETQPSGYAEGKEALGTSGGTLGTGQFTGITLAAGVAGANYNFGETLLSIAVSVSLDVPTTVYVGQSFTLQGYVQDVRANPQGVAEAFVNVSYNTSLMSVTSAITHGSQYSGTGASGNTTTPGLINSVGGVSTGLNPPANPGSDYLLFSVPFQALEAGTFTFTPQLLTGSNYTLYPVAVFPVAALDPVQVSLVSGSITIENPPPTVATAAAASPNPVTGATCNLSVLGADNAGESSLSYTWSTTGTPPAAVNFSTNGSNAAKNTTATFSKAGNYSFQVTITDRSGLTATSTVNVTVNQTLTAISVSPPSASLNAGGTQQYTAVAKDQFGAAMALQPTFTWATAAGTISTAGLLTTPDTSAANATVTASSGSVHGTATFSAVAQPPTVATAAAASPNTVTGTTSNLSVLGADDTGESNLTYTWSTTGTPPAAVSFSANGSNAAKDTTATFSKAGSYSFQVTITDPGGLTATSTVNVTVNQTLTAITLSPASLSLRIDGTQQYTATAKDQFGTALALQPTFTWLSTAGTISTAGLLTAPGTPVANATVTASSGTVSGTATFSAADQPPTVATPAAASSNPVTGVTCNLSVLGAYVDGESNLTYTWSTTGTPPAAVGFSTNGSNAAKNTTATFSKAGNYSFQVTITDPSGLTATSSVNVTVNQTLTAIAVSPPSVTLNAGGTQQYTATAKDQFGTALAVQPTFTWATTAGTISTTGLLTAPDTSAADATVTASSGTVSGTATFSATAQPPTVATPAAASPNPVTGTTCNLSVLGAGRHGRIEPDLHLVHHRHAAGRGQLQRQRQQRGQEHHRHLQQGGQLQLPGHDHRPQRLDGHQQRQCDGQPDAHGDYRQPGVGQL